MEGCSRRTETAFEIIPGTDDNHQIWLPKTHFILKMILIVLAFSPGVVSTVTDDSANQRFFQANFNITYTDPKTNKTSSVKYENGRFGIGVNGAQLKVAAESGRVVVVKTESDKTDGCTDYNVTIPNVKWVALIARGECAFSDKIERAKKYNASAVVIYNHKDDKDKNLHVMEHGVLGIVAISIPDKEGLQIAGLVNRGINVTMYITVGREKSTPGSENKNPSKTSVVFVSVSFIVLMIISLAWLVFYYIQRFRYAHAKERLARRLASAAKKAIAKIPQKTIKTGDKEMSSDFDQCAVCIEGYKAHDVIRTLPCKHVFHKSCVDPWLLDQRSCPMCKLDILRAYGMHVGGSEDSVHPDGESGNAIGAVEDLEQTSVGDEQSADGEVKVLLLPQHVCLHHGGETSGAGGRASIDSSHITCDPSEECAHSSDSECTELHSLMDHIGAAGVEASCVPADQKDSDTEDLSV